MSECDNCTGAEETFSRMCESCTNYENEQVDKLRDEVEKYKQLTILNGASLKNTEKDNEKLRAELEQKCRSLIVSEEQLRVQTADARIKQKRIYELESGIHKVAAERDGLQRQLDAITQDCGESCAKEISDLRAERDSLRARLKDAEILLVDATTCDLPVGMDSEINTFLRGGAV